MINLGAICNDPNAAPGTNGWSLAAFLEGPFCTARPAVLVDNGIPATVTAGTVGIQGGGAASQYSFSADGLSNDTRLAPYLQNLTPSQLQDALNGGTNVNQSLIDLLYQDLSGTGAGWLPDGGSQTPTTTFQVPTWFWLVSAGALAFAAFRR